MTPDVDAAARFLAANARVLDRRRFERLFSGGDARPVRDAVAAFRNSDGGFGHALEPDGRTPASQPAAVMMALDTLDEADAWDEELVAGACAWLAANAAAEGEVHTPLDFAPNPDSIARRLFDEATIEAHLDHLARGQADDGGWTFNWLAWSPVAASEWRGSLTVDALRTLRASGRL